MAAARTPRPLPAWLAGAWLRFDLRVAMAIAWVATGALYLATMSRSVGFVDRGEMAAVAATLGIAHPTGYPTLTMLGHLATRLWPGEPILALNTFAALCVAAGAATVVALATRLMRLAGMPAPPRRRRRSGTRPPGATTPDRIGSDPPATDPPSRVAIALLTALLIATGGVWWQQAMGFEAYALHALLLPLVLLAVARWIGAERGAPGDPAHPPVARRAFLFGLAVGLSFTNHMTTLVAAPALIVVVLGGIGVRRTLARAPWVVAGVAVGLLPYVYLPLRAAADPRFDWGGVDTWQGFGAHVSGWQFRVWMFAGVATFRRQLEFITQLLPPQLAYAGLALAVWGVVALARRAARWAVAVVLLVSSCVLYAANYEIRDLEPYLLAAVLALGLAAAAGLERVRARAGARVAIGVAAALVVVNVGLNHRSSDEHGLTLSRDLAVNLLQGMPRGSMLVTTQWDHVVSPLLALQELEGLRPDVRVIDPELLRRSWYLDELEHRAGSLTSAAAGSIARFRREVAPFEAGRPHDGSAIHRAYVAMVDSLIRAGAAEGPVFVTLEVSPEFAAGAQRVPYLLARWLRWDDTYVAQPEPDWTFRPWRGRLDAHVTMTHRLYAEALLARASYEANHGYPDRARALLDQALAFDPRVDPSRLAPMALDGPENVLETVMFFDRLRMARRMPGRR